MKTTPRYRLIRNAIITLLVSTVINVFWYSLFHLYDENDVTYVEGTLNNVTHYPGSKSRGYYVLEITNAPPCNADIDEGKILKSYVGKTVTVGYVPVWPVFHKTYRHVAVDLSVESVEEKITDLDNVNRIRAYINAYMIFIEIIAYFGVNILNISEIIDERRRLKQKQMRKEERRRKKETARLKYSAHNEGKEKS